MLNQSLYCCFQGDNEQNYEYMCISVSLCFLYYCCVRIGELKTRYVELLMVTKFIPYCMYQVYIVPLSIIVFCGRFS